MDDGELLAIFWGEVEEYLTSLNAGVLSLEMSRGQDDNGQFVATLRELNRVAHSMKGAARAVGVERVEKLSYYMEEVFDAALHRGLALTPEVCDLLYDALDLVQAVSDGEANTEREPALFALVEERLARTLSTQEMTEAVIEAHELENYETETRTQTGINQVPQSGNNPRASDEHPAIEVPAVPATDESRESVEDSDPTEPKPRALAPREAQTVELPTTSTTTMTSRIAEDAVRVPVSKLDKLMAETGEMLVLRMQSEARSRELDEMRAMLTRWNREWRNVRKAYIQLNRKLQNEDVLPEMFTVFKFLETNQRHLATFNRDLNALTGRVVADTMRLSTLADTLQEDVGSLRLVPFDSILGTLQRTVRDSARETGKTVNLDVIGGSVEIDKTVLESLKDPLMHLLRNAVDHGIETEQERSGRQKPAAGWIYINVESRGSEILVLLADDGRGIDALAVRAAAVRNGIITEAEAEALSDDEAKALIFRPDVTTRHAVTPISGRGVGLDVVRERIESLRGRVSLASEVGRGTRFALSVPVSLTRIRCITFDVGGEQYAIPSLYVQRMETVPQSSAMSVEGKTLITFNDRTMSLVSLASVLDSQTDAPGNHLRVMVLHASDRNIAFAVDELLGEQELVLKALGPELTRARYVSGAALLEGGEVIIVLDASALVRHATSPIFAERFKPRGSDRLPHPEEAPADPADHAVSGLRVLVVDDSITTRTLEKNILETAGCDVRVAIDGVEAWDILEGQPFDVVVSDIEMPRMNGLELTERIKRTASTQHLPVILLTSLGKPEQREAGLRAGADAYLVKTRFDQDELLRTIEAVL